MAPNAGYGRRVRTHAPQHPRLLAQTVNNWLARGRASRVVVELPLREAYLPQVEELKRLLKEMDLELLDSGEEVGQDDWGTENGDTVDVRCWWGIWGDGRS